jgi:hypothetical protein
MMFMTRQQTKLNRFIQELAAEGRYFQIQYARGDSSWAGSRTDEGYILLGRGEPVGVYVAWEDTGGVLHFGWSLRHPKKEVRPFNRIEGVLRALSVSRWPLQVAMAKMPQARFSEFCDFMDNAKEYHEKRRNKRIADAIAASPRESLVY